MIIGFSKLTEQQKIELLDNLNQEEKKTILESFDVRLSKLTENVIGSYSLPLSVVPNCKINNKNYFVPMATEESSIVAACANAFKFINQHGGFESRVVSSIKKGTIYFDNIKGLDEQIRMLSIEFNPEFISINQNMKERGGGFQGYFFEEIGAFLKMNFSFNTNQAMGANFINTLLEKTAEIIKDKLKIEAIFCILSNNYDSCLTESKFQIPINFLNHTKLSPSDFLKKFIKAMDIANLDIDRTVTHNKGFMNGVDAVLLATGQDYRAMNAAIHSFAFKNLKYQSLSEYKIENNNLVFYSQIPVSVGVVGGITKAHPTSQIIHKIIDSNLSTEVLAQIIVSTGLAQNFSAVSALISEGIQRGHMKMHLDNILLQLQASSSESLYLKDLLSNQKVSFKTVKEELDKIRNKEV